MREAIPVLAGMVGTIGDRHVRNRGTIGGSVANNDPAADYPAAVLGLGATVVTDRRRIAADDFFVALYETALEPGEIVTAIDFPVPDQAGYAKFRSAASRYAVAAVFVAKFGAAARAAVTGAGSGGVFRCAILKRSWRMISARWLLPIARSIPGICSKITSVRPSIAPISLWSWRAGRSNVSARRVPTNSSCSSWRG